MGSKPATVRVLAIASIAAVAAGMVSFAAATAALSEGRRATPQASATAAADTAQEKSSAETCGQDTKCLYDAARAVTNLRQLEDLFATMAEDPSFSCHSVGQDAAHAALNAGSSWRDVVAVVSQQQACQGGFFDGTFGWMGTHGGWGDQAQVDDVVQWCLGLADGSQVQEACADGVGDGFMQGSSTLGDALDLCSNFPRDREQLLALCVGQVANQAFLPSWDKTVPPVHSVDEAIEVLEPFCAEVLDRFGDWVLTGCIDGMSHPLARGADSATRSAANKDELAQAASMWDTAEDSCSKLDRDAFEDLCYGFVGARAGWATVNSEQARSFICTDKRRGDFTARCREVDGV